MPVYEYRCTSCGDELEVTQSFDDDPLTECPTCQGALKKKFGVPAITFKGGGFYKTDSRGAPSSSTTGGSSSSGTSGDAGSSSDSGSSDSGSSSSGDSGSGDSGSSKGTSKSTESSGGSSSSKEAATA